MWRNINVSKKALAELILLVKTKIINQKKHEFALEEMVFEYKQVGNILTSEYSGGQIVKGQLIGLVDKDGNIDMRYHKINNKRELLTGILFFIIVVFSLL
jgi:hypothetical protein